MNAFECPREHDVLDAVASGRWPDGDAGLQAHVAQCAICRDLGEVASALALEHVTTWQETGRDTLPPGHVVWWRAQMRARGEAARLAARPITMVQTLGTASAVGVVAAVAAKFDGSLQPALDWVSTRITGFTALLDPSADVVSLVGRAILVAAGIWLALTPVAIYLATDE